MNRQLTRLLAICFFVVSFAGGCKKTETDSAPTASATGITSTQLTLDWKPEPEFGGFYAAQQAGLFKSNGLDVTIKSAGAGAPTWQLVATGQTDFATTAADQVLIARSRGADVVALFAVYQTMPLGIMVHSARGFKKIDDVFTNTGTLAAIDETWLHYCLGKFPSPKVKVTGYSGGVAAFLAKPDYSQQCFITSEPITARKQNGDPQTFLVADLGYNPYTTVVIASGATIRKKPALVKAMFTASRDGWRTYLDDPTATHEVMGKLNTDMDAATFAAAAEAQKPLIETADTKAFHLGVMTMQRWEVLAKQLVDLKVVEKAIPAGECYVDPADWK